jgi:riboflavin kinase / FMN adenylyltransferase
MPTAVTIGNFDGVHLGHAALVRAARERVGTSEAGGRVVVMAFSPHPASVLRPGSEPPTLTPLEVREEWLRGLPGGVDEVVRLDPRPGMQQGEPLLAKSARVFVEGVVERYSPTALVEGPDFHFGKGRSGNVRVLAELGRELGFETIVVPPVEASLSDGTVVTASSTMARWLLGHGRVGDVARVLGRPVEIRGEVVRGDRRGRELGFPTANISLDGAWKGVMLPADGVYLGTAAWAGGAARAMVNIGTRPTVAGTDRRVEAHVLVPGGAWTPLPGVAEYGWTIRLTLERWLRDQVKFAGVPALVAQLERDRRRAAALT